MTPKTRIKTQSLDSSDIEKILTRVAHEILERGRDSESICLVGIRSRGAILAQRLTRLLKSLSKKPIEMGTLDITLYRDDLNHSGPNPVVQGTEIPYDVTGRSVVIVDDVLFTGRTVRAAMDALTDLGRPEVIELAVLVDRGHRELPIRADYVGKNLPTTKEELVQVHLTETDGQDEVLIEEAIP